MKQIFLEKLIVTQLVK